MKLRPFVWAPISLTGTLLKSYPDEIHDAPEADLVLGGPAEDWSYPEWTQDRHGQIRKGHQLKALGRYLYELRDVTVVKPGNGRLYLCLAPGIVCAEATPSAGLKLPENAELHVDFPEGRVDINLMPDLPAERRESRPSVLYAHDWANNLFHHYMDTVPRQWAQDEGLLPADVIEVDTAPGAVRYDTLYYPSFYPASGYAPTTLPYIRRKMLPDGVLDRKRRPLILYLSRSDARTRRVTNEAAVFFDVLCRQRLSCGSVHMGKLSLSEQVNAIQEASIIVAPHGAALMNVAFTSAAYVIELVPEERQPCCYQYVAKWAGNRYARIICPSGESQDMMVPLDHLQTALRAAIDATTT